MKFLPKAVLFDAYGTLLDVYSVGQAAEALFPGRGDVLARLWRDKQVEYTRLRSMAGQYRPFWDVTREALQFCCAALGLPSSESQQQVLMEAYGRLSAFAENPAALARIRAAGIPMAIHTNGNPDMIAQAVRSAGLEQWVDVVLSADAVKRYKVDPQVYRLATHHFGVPANELLFVSANGWDICGATWFGFTTFWVNRAGAPREQLGVTPAFEGATLTEVADLVCS